MLQLGISVLILSFFVISGCVGHLPPLGSAGTANENSSIAFEAGNNTSASGLYTDLYYNYALKSVSGAGNMPPRNVSKVDVHALLGSLGTTTKVFVETQTWFCHNTSNESGGKMKSSTGPNTGPSCGSHLDIGYNSDDAAHVREQINDMMSRGFDGVTMDWPGTHNTAVTGAVLKFAAEATQHLNPHTGFPFEIAVMEDQAVKSCANGTYGTCNVTDQIINDINWLYANVMQYPSYMRAGGRPIVPFFSPDYYASNGGQTIDWSRVRSSVHGNPLLIFQNFGHAQGDGAFGWEHPNLFTSCVDSTSCYGSALSSLSNFYDGATGGPYAMGAVFKGFFDAHVNGWHFNDGTNNTRYVAQRCGQTWLDGFATARSRFAGNPAALDSLQVVTWDDYEEGSEIETGIDNCVSSLKASVIGGKLNWSISFGGDIKGYQGSEKTIHHYIIYSSPDGANLVPLKDIMPDSSGSFTHSVDLGGLGVSPGTTLYVKAVGQPSIVNHLSNPVTY